MLIIRLIQLFWLSSAKRSTFHFIKEGTDEPVANDTCQITYENNYTNKSKAHPPGWALAFNTKTLWIISISEQDSFY